MLGLSAVPSVWCALGKATFRVCATMYVDATMRMTSNTSMISTMGVTLMAEMVLTRPPVAIVPAILRARLHLMAWFLGDVVNHLFLFGLVLFALVPRGAP